MSLPPFPGRNPEDNSEVPQRPSYNPENYAEQQPPVYATPDNTYQAQPAGQPAPARSGLGKTGLVVGASVLSLAVLAGGAFAAASFLNKATDRDISIALPQSTSAFVVADLDPSPGQKINLVSVAEKIKAISGEKNYDTNKDPKEMFTDLFFSKLDYETEVQPWIGDKVALGAWGDFAKASADAIEGSTSASNVSKDISAVVVYEIKDKEKADEAAKKIDKEGAVYEVNEHYLIIAASQSALDSYNAEIAKGTLDKNKTFTDDRNLLNGQDNVAMSWVNAGDLHADEALKKYLSYTVGTDAEVPDNLSGRVVTGVSVSDKSLKVSSKLVGFDTTGASTEKGLSDVGNLPDNSSIVVGVKDGKTAATKFWNTYKSSESSPAGGYMDEQLQHMDITLPDDFGALLGTETSFGMSPDGDNVGVTYRAKDGDVDKIDGIIKSMGAESSQIATTDENGTAVVKYGKTSNGKLSDSQSFKSVTGDLRNAQAVVFFDINKVKHERSAAMGTDTHQDVNYGVAGLTSSFDPSSKIVSVDISWAF